MAQSVTVAGIDVSKAWLDVALWPDEDVAVLHVERSQVGCFDTLVAWLSGHGVKRVGLEASGGYESEVVDALQARGFEVIRFNAYRIRLFAKSNGRLAKNDHADAWVIAHATAVLPVKQLALRQHRLDPLVELLNDRRQLCDWIVDCANPFEHLKDKALRKQTERRKASLVRERAAADKKLADLLASAGPWNDLARLLQSVPGVGPVLATTLIALLPELGQLSRRNIASLAGVAPFDNDSGRRRGERHVQGGRTALRHVLYMATLTAMRHNPVIAGHAAAPPACVGARADRAQRIEEIHRCSDDRCASADARRTRIAVDPLHPAEPELQLLIQQLRFQLPPQPPPKITATTVARAT